MSGVEVLSDRSLAERLREAERVGDLDASYEALNEVLYRAGVPLDESEQGVSAVGSRMVETWCAEVLS